MKTDNQKLLLETEKLKT